MQPRKRFGQNFLTDQDVIARIINAFDPKVGEKLVEIGPGRGALTEQLLWQTKKLTVIELDRDLIPYIKAKFKNYDDLHIINADVLNFDFNDLNFNSKIRIIGNLPYNISTPLLFHLFHYNQMIHDMCFMLQREVAHRLAAMPNEKNYGRLSVMVQYHCQIHHLFDVPPSAFEPQPQVTSSMIMLRPHQKLPYLAKNYLAFQNIVREAFNHRRKTLHNSLKGWVSDEVFKAVNIDPKRRAETLSLAEFVALANGEDMRNII